MGIDYIAGEAACVFGSQPGRQPQHFHVVPAMAASVVKALRAQGFRVVSGERCLGRGPVLTVTRDFDS
ncbi:MAG: hypothetical protein O2854_09400 [Chloroflexi bacterium]|nr:hypothetical protein [Chloroflexota bacterium]